MVIETVAVFLMVLLSFGFVYIVNRNLLTLLAMSMYVIFLAVLDYSDQSSAYLALFIIFALVLLALKFYSSMRD
jgi:hypothetical protein